MCREEPERSRVGGVPGKVVEANALWLVLWNHELLRMFAAVLSMSLVRVGDAVFSTGCVTMGNPFGRIAIAAVTNRQESLFDARWRTADSEDPNRRRVARR